MTKDKKESESLEKVHRDLIANKSSSLVKRALDDLARLKAQPPSGPEHTMDLLKKRQIRVVIGNYVEHLNNLFSELIKEVIKDKYSLTIKSVFYGEELMKIAENAEADIFIVVVNNIRFRPFYPPQKRIEKSVQLITQIKRAFDKPMIVVFPLELEERVRQTGADFYYFPLYLYEFDDDFQLYDEFDDDFMMAFEKCMHEVL